MAVNIPLTTGPEGPFPLPFMGEVFLLTRDKTEVSFRDSARTAKRLKGRLFMTNLRFVSHSSLLNRSLPCTVSRV